MPNRNRGVVIGKGTFADGRVAPEHVHTFSVSKGMFPPSFRVKLFSYSQGRNFLDDLVRTRLAGQRTRLMGGLIERVIRNLGRNIC